MKNLFVPYDIAKKLKKLGFSEPCVARFEHYIQSKQKHNNISISEMSFDFIDNRIKYGGLKNYNTDFYSKEGTISAPLYQQVIIWLNDNYNIDISINSVMLDAKIEEALKIISKNQK